MAWLVRVVLAATTSAGSRLPAPGCPMGLGGSRRGCGLVVVRQQRDRGRGQGAGGQLGWVSATYRQGEEGQEGTSSWLLGRVGRGLRCRGKVGVGDLEVLVMGQGRVRGKGPRGWSVTVRLAASNGHACDQQTRTCMTRGGQA
ncbi:hypothetical protein HaLaN_09589, partial [Haematococcus lacustris]